MRAGLNGLLNSNRHHFRSSINSTSKFDKDEIFCDVPSLLETFK